MTRFRLILTLSVLTFACSRSGKAEPEIHLIPEGFTGCVTIAFNAANGEPLTREGKSRVYRIGSDGVLLLNAPTNIGVFYDGELEYYYVAASGQRTKLPVEHRVGVTRDQLQVFAEGTGSSAHPVGNVASTSGQAMKWTAYCVGVPSEDRKWDKLADDVLAKASSRYFAKKQ
jgi:hypothetical protein